MERGIARLLADWFVPVSAVNNEGTEWTAGAHYYFPENHSADDPPPEVFYFRCTRGADPGRRQIKMIYRRITLNRS